MQDLNYQRLPGYQNYHGYEGFQDNLSYLNPENDRNLHSNIYKMTKRNLFEREQVLTLL